MKLKQTVLHGVLSLALAIPLSFLIRPAAVQASMFGEENIVLGKIFMQSLEQVKQAVQQYNMLRQQFEEMSNIRNLMQKGIDYAKDQLNQQRADKEAEKQIPTSVADREADNIRKMVETPDMSAEELEKAFNAKCAEYLPEKLPANAQGVRPSLDAVKIACADQARKQRNTWQSARNVKLTTSGNVWTTGMKKLTEASGKSAAVNQLNAVRAGRQMIVTDFKEAAQSSRAVVSEMTDSMARAGATHEDKLRFMSPIVGLSTLIGGTTLEWGQAATMADGTRAEGVAYNDHDAVVMTSILMGSTPITLDMGRTDTAMDDDLLIKTYSRVANEQLVRQHIQFVTSKGFTSYMAQRTAGLIKLHNNFVASPTLDNFHLSSIQLQTDMAISLQQIHLAQKEQDRLLALMLLAIRNAGSGGGFGGSMGGAGAAGGTPAPQVLIAP